MKTTNSTDNEATLLPVKPFKVLSTTDHFFTAVRRSEQLTNVALVTRLWAGYIGRIYPGTTQELNQILGPFWFVYTAESPQDLKKSVNKPEYTQKLLRNSIKFWALSSLFMACLH